MKESAFALVLISLFATSACKKKSSEPPPDPNAIKHCSIEAAKVAGGTLELARINISGGFDDHTLKLPGKLAIDVNHTANGVEKRACGGAVMLTAASYDATGAAKASVPLDGKCAAPPAGSVISVRPTFTPEGKTGPFADFICTFVADIPREIGGTGENVLTQRARVGWESFAKTNPKTAGPILAYVDSMVAVAKAAGDPAKPRAASPCPGTVKGRAIMFTYREVRRLASYAKGGLEFDEKIDEPSGPMGQRLKGDDAAQKILDARSGAPDEQHKNEVAAASSALGENAPRFVVVLSSRDYRMPKIEESASANKTGVYTAGTFDGSVAIVDRQTGALVCGAPFSATSTGKAYKPTDEFVAAIEETAWRTAVRIAPGLTH